MEKGSHHDFSNGGGDGGYDDNGDENDDFKRLLILEDLNGVSDEFSFVDKKIKIQRFIQRYSIFKFHSPQMEMNQNTGLQISS